MNIFPQAPLDSVDLCALCFSIQDGVNNVQIVS
jgi:hypothetical protein